MKKKKNEIGKIIRYKYGADYAEFLSYREKKLNAYRLRDARIANRRSVIDIIDLIQY